MAEQTHTLDTVEYEEIEDTGDPEELPAVRPPCSMNPVENESSLAKRSRKDIIPHRERVALALIEEEVFRESMDMINGMNAFSDIDPSDTHPPQEWIDQLGKKKAWKKFRIAKSSWMGSKEAPIALRIVPPIAGAIMRARVGLTPMEGLQRAKPIEFPVSDITVYEEIIVKD